MKTRIRRLLLGALLAAVAHACAQAGEEAVTIQDFEKKIEIGTWPPGAKYEFSTDWAADGRQSLKLHAKTMVAISEMSTRDWRPYQVWRFHVKVPGNEGVNIGLELADDVNGYNNRHQNSSSAPPGESVVDIDIGGDLWRGERNKPYREDKTPIHQDRMNRFAIVARGGVIYIDKIQLVKIPKLECDGGFAFDFGKKGTTVQSQWIGINEQSSWDGAKGCGLRGGVGFVNPVTPYPTLVMGDGLRMHSATFDVRLKGGAYLGWVVFERSGFWGGQQAVYTRATLEANGQAVHSHANEPAAPWFKLQDVEALTVEDVVSKIVLPRQKVADFKFDATAGRNSFRLRVEGGDRMPPRLAGLVLAPDSPEGRAFMKAHKEAQLDVVRKTHSVLKKERRPGDPARAAEPLVVTPLPTDQAMYPRDWPDLTKSQPVPAMKGLGGMTAHRLIGLYGAAKLTVTAGMSEMKSRDGSLPADAVRLMANHYLPTHSYGETAVHVETHDYRPLESLTVTPDVARSILVSIDIPEGTRAGTYRGVLTLKCAGENNHTARVPLSLEVVPGELPPIDWPVGLFFSGVSVPRSLISDETYWKLSEDLFRLLRMGSKTMLTAGPGFTVTPDGVRADDALKYLRIAKRYGLTRRMVNYGGLGIGGSVTDPAIYRSWEKWRKANNVPDIYLNTFDEPSLASQFAPIERKLKARRAAGFRTIGWTSMRDPDKADENHKMLVRESHAAAFNLHTPKTLKWANSIGNEAWIYNNGLSRYHQGVHLWRNRRSGANGRIDWICSIVQGYQFDALDSREPDLSCVYFHKELGVLPAPRFLGVCEGGFDARLLHELERRLKKDPSGPKAAEIKRLFDELESKPYRQALPWDELERLRDRMIGLMG